MVESDRFEQTNMRSANAEPPLFIPPLTGYPGACKIAKSRWKGLLSLIIGAAAFILFAAVINIPLAIASIVLGVMQLLEKGPKGSAVMGMVLSVLSLILLVIYWGSMGRLYLGF